MSRFDDYETAVPRRRGGYGAYNDTEEAPRGGRTSRRDDPYSSVRPLPPRVSASSVYDTFRPPNLHGSASSTRDHGRDDSRREPYSSRPPPRAAASAYDTYRPPPPRSGGGRDGDRDSGYSTRDSGRDPYSSNYARRAPPENDYGAYATYRPPSKPSAEYVRKLEKYAGVTTKRSDRRDDRSPVRGRSRRDESDSEDESPVRSRRSKREKKKKKSKAKKRREEVDSDETEDEEDSESSSEESSSEEEVRKKKSKSKKKKKSKSEKKKKGKKSKKVLSDSDDSEDSEEESESEEEKPAPVSNALAIMPADPAALGVAAFSADNMMGGTGGAANMAAGGMNLMGEDTTSTALVPAGNAGDFANMPGEFPQDSQPKGSLAGRFPQLGSAVATPFGPGVMTGQGLMPQGGAGAMGGMGGMPGMNPMMAPGMGGMGGMGMGPGMMGMQGMGAMGGAGGMGAMGGMGNGNMGQPGVQAMGAMGGAGMQQGMGMMPAAGMMQGGMMNAGQPDLLTQDFNAMNFGGTQ